MLKLREIRNALKNTHSLAAASRYLNCSYPTLRKYLYLYGFKIDDYKNQAGKGVRRFYSGKPRVDLQKILEGKIEYKNKQYLAWLLIKAGIIQEKCMYCGFEVKRTIDQRAPLTLTFRNRDPKNLELGNLLLLCFNCYYLHKADVTMEKIIAEVEKNI